LTNQPLTAIVVTVKKYLTTM